MASKKEFRDMKKQVVEMQKSLLVYEEQDLKYKTEIKHMQDRAEKVKNDIPQVNESAVSLRKEILKCTKALNECTEIQTNVEKYELTRNNYYETLCSVYDQDQWETRMSASERGLAELEGSIRETRTVIENAAAEINAGGVERQKRRDELNEAKEVLREAIANFNGLMTEHEQVKEKLTAARGEIEEVRKENGMLRDRVEELTALLERQKSGHDARDDELQGIMGEDRKRIVAMEERMGTVTELVDKVGELNNFRVAVERDVERTKSDVAKGIAEKMQDVDEKIAALEQSGKDLKAFAESARGEIEQRQSLADANKAEMASLCTKVGDFHAQASEKITTLEETTAKFMAKHGRLEKRAKSLTEKMRVNKDEVVEAIEAETKRAMEKEHELGELYARLEQQATEMTSESNQRLSRVTKTVKALQAETNQDVTEFKASSAVERDDVKNSVKDCRSEVEKTIREVEAKFKQYKAEVIGDVNDSNGKLLSRVEDISASLDLLMGDGDTTFADLIANVSALQGQVDDNAQENKENMQQMKKNLEDTTNDIRQKADTDMDAIANEIEAMQKELMRTIEKAVDDDRQRAVKQVGDLEARIGVVSETLGSVEVDFAKDVAKTRRSIDDAQSRIKELVDKFAVVSGEFEKSIEDLDASTVSLDRQMTKYRKSTSKKFKGMNERIGETASAMDASIEMSRASAKKGVKSLRKALRSQTERWEEIKGGIDAIDAALVEQATASKEVEIELNANWDRIREDMVASMGSEVGQLAQSISSLKQSLDLVIGDSEISLPSLIQDVEALKDRMNNSLEHADERMKEWRSQFEDIFTSFKNEKQSDIDEIKASVGESADQIRTSMTEAMQVKWTTFTSSITRLSEKSTAMTSDFTKFMGDGNTTLAQSQESVVCLREDSNQQFEKLMGDLAIARDDFEQGDAKMRSDIEVFRDSAVDDIGKLRIEHDSLSTAMREQIDANDKDANERDRVIQCEIDTLRGDSVETFPTIMNTLVRMQNELKANNAELTAKLDEFDRATKNSFDVFDAKLDRMTGGSSVSLAEIETLQAKLEEESQELDRKQTEHFSQVTKQVKTMTQKNKALSTALTNKLETLTEGLTTLRNDIAEETATLRTDMTQLITDKDDSLNKELNDFRRSMQRTMDSLSNAMGKQVASCKQAQGDAVSIADKLQSEMLRISKREVIRQQAEREMEQRLKDVVTECISAVDLKVTQFCQGAIPRVELALDTLREQLLQKSDATYAKLNTVAAGLHQSLETMQGGSSTTLAELVNIMQELQAAVTHSSEHMNEKMDDMQEQVNKSMDANNMELDKNKEEMRKRLRQLEKQVNNFDVTSMKDAIAKDVEHEISNVVGMARRMASEVEYNVSGHYATQRHDAEKFECSVIQQIDDISERVNAIRGQDGFLEHMQTYIREQVDSLRHTVAEGVESIRADATRMSDRVAALEKSGVSNTSGNRRRRAQ